MDARLKEKTKTTKQSLGLDLDSMTMWILRDLW